MKRLLILTTICASLLVNPVGVYAGDTTDVSASVIADLMEEAIKNQDNKDDIISDLKGFLETDKGIDNLKEVIDLKMDDSKEAILNEKGITIKDVMNGIDGLKEWDYEDREKMIDYVSEGKTEKAAKLIENDGKEVTEVPYGGGGGIGPSKEENPDLESDENKNIINHKFKDIKGHWAEESIGRMTSIGIVSGVDEETFIPDGYVTRGEMATLMVKILGLDIDTPVYMPFEDVQTSDWYYKYVRGAYHNNIVSGISETLFNPDGKINREQMITMAIETLGDIAIDTENILLDEYKDKDLVSSWAIEFMKKGKKLDLLRLNENLNPQEQITRAEAVWVLDKIYNNINENRGIKNEK